MTAAPLHLPKSEIFQAIQKKKKKKEIEQPVRSTSHAFCGRRSRWWCSLADRCLASLV